MTMRFTILIILLTAVPAFAADDPVPDYHRDVAPIFRKYCNGCHNDKDREGELSLETIEQLRKGGASGRVVLPKKPDESYLLEVLTGEDRSMPPEGERPPTAEEIAVLTRWIAAGAPGPKKGSEKTLVVPDIEPEGEVRKPIQSAAWSPDGRVLALGRYGTVEILDGESRKVIRTLEGPAGQVNDVGFSKSGKLFFAAGGEPGLYGEVKVYKTRDWSLARTLKGHRDSLYAAAFSPSGRFLATGGYDQLVLLWEVSKGASVRSYRGHNGPIFDIAYHPSGKIFATASGDSTVKLWDVASAQRLDTFGQPTKAQYALAFRKDGKYLAAGGVDNRIRVWEIREMGKEGASPQIHSSFAHEEPIIGLEYAPNGKTLVSSSEDGTVKLWDAKTMLGRGKLEPQPDWPSALAVSPSSRGLLVGRMDGSWKVYNLEDISSGAAPSKPLTHLPLPEPHGGPDRQPEKTAELEPNDTPAKAQQIALPAVIEGTIDPGDLPSPDADLYRFSADQGDWWVIETNAARQDFPVDTKVEVLHGDGKPVLRLLLRAVRDSEINFRPIDSRSNQVRVDFWEEMELNQFLYMSGEVCKIYRMPRGPDSGIMFYTVRGKRRCYFDTSGTVHALGDDVYIVEPYPPEATFPETGLPVFKHYYVNDDDGNRELGRDSRLMFTPPEDGEYIVRVSDTRGFGGPFHRYELTLRRAQPGFKALMPKAKKTIPEGSGQRLVMKVDRIDDFEGPVRFDIKNVPEGFEIPSPIVVEAGHAEAQGVIRAAAGTKNPSKQAWENVRVTARGVVDGEEVVQELGHLGEMIVGEKPKVRVFLERDQGSGPGGSNELVIAPGTSITATLRIERSGFEGDLKFELDNLPHGVIVDNIGLSGILIRAGENERQIIITCADWVPETTRWVHATALGAGNQASNPMVFHVRRP